MVIKARSEVTAEGGEQIEGKRVLVIEDGPTLTHGEMRYGAGVVAAKKHGAAEIVDPRDYAVGTLKDTYAKYDIGDVLPAMGYSDQQLKDMEQMMNSVPADVVVVASPIDLRHLLDIQKPAVRVVVRPGRGAGLAHHRGRAEEGPVGHLP